MFLLEIDTEGVIPGDTDPPQEMGDSTKEVSESDENEVRKWLFVYDLRSDATLLHKVCLLVFFD